MFHWFLHVNRNNIHGKALFIAPYNVLIALTNSALLKVKFGWNLRSNNVVETRIEINVTEEVISTWWIVRGRSSKSLRIFSAFRQKLFVTSSSPLMHSLRSLEEARRSLTKSIWNLISSLFNDATWLCKSVIRSCIWREAKNIQYKQLYSSRSIKLKCFERNGWPFSWITIQTQDLYKIGYQCTIDEDSRLYLISS